MSLRRFGPLMAACTILLVVLVARLFQVQVLEHDVWAREAANLSRENEVLPYLRGEIRDRNGVVLAQDESVYRLEFVYRSFRREHVLGQVAHALSDVHGHAVGLKDAARLLEGEAQRLVLLTPRDVDAFERGGWKRRTGPHHGLAAISANLLRLFFAAGGCSEGPTFRLKPPDQRRRRIAISEKENFSAHAASLQSSARPALDRALAPPQI